MSGGLLFTLDAAAEAPPSPIRYELAYEAPAGCPSRDAVVQRVASFAPSTTLVNREGLARVHLLVAEKDGFSSVISVVKPDEPETRRALPAASCAEAVEAAALVIAILLDPEAASRPQTAASTPPETASPPRAPAADVARREAPRPRPPAPKPATWPDATSDGGAVRPAAARSAGGRWIFGGITQGGATWAIAPRAAFEAGIGATLESDQLAVFSPWFALSANFAESLTTRVASRSVKFQLFSSQLRACPARLWLGSLPIGIGPCVRLELGRLQGQGRADGSSRSPAIFWAAAGAAGRAEVRLRWLTLALEAGATFPFRRDTFYFDPDRATVFRVPSAAFSTGFAAGASFP